MSEDVLNYPRLLQQAVLGVVRQALRVAADDGLPGEHHFYLTFRTDAPGVRIPAFLRQRFPEEMTIVIQHQYWNLAVDEDCLAVTLRFGGAPEHLQIPFAALTAFADPSVSFGLRFDNAEPGTAPRSAAPPVALGPRPVAAAAKLPAQRPAATRARRTGTRAVGAVKKTTKKTAAPAAAPTAAERERTTTKVVDFQSFRRSATDEPREP